MPYASLDSWPAWNARLTDRVLPRPQGKRHDPSRKGEASMLRKLAFFAVLSVFLLMAGKKSEFAKHGGFSFSTRVMPFPLGAREDTVSQPRIPSGPRVQRGIGDRKS